MSSILNFDDTDPPPDPGYINVKWKKNPVSAGIDPTTGYPFFNMSGEVPSGGGPGSGTHSESLTDGNANFIFAATLTTGGDIITVVGVPD